MPLSCPWLKAMCHLRESAFHGAWMEAKREPTLEYGFILLSLASPVPPGRLDRECILVNIWWKSVRKAQIIGWLCSLQLPSNFMQKMCGVCVCMCAHSVTCFCVCVCMRVCAHPVTCFCVCVHVCVCIQWLAFACVCVCASSDLLLHANSSL